MDVLRMVTIVNPAKGKGCANMADEKLPVPFAEQVLLSVDVAPILERKVHVKYALHSHFVPMEIRKNDV
jgi:hypothetical protein